MIMLHSYLSRLLKIARRGGGQDSTCAIVDRRGLDATSNVSFNDVDALIRGSHTRVEPQLGRVHLAAVCAVAGS
jgi:hypothetical protein